MTLFVGSAIEWIRGRAARPPASGLICATCQAHASDGWCAKCGAVCPFCGSPSLCKHTVLLDIGFPDDEATKGHDKDEKEVSLLLPSPVSGACRPKWTRQNVEQRFGPLSPLAECYGNRLDQEPDPERVLLAAVACSTSEAAVVLERLVHSGLLSTYGHLFVADRPRFAAEMAVASEQLRQVFAVAVTNAQNTRGRSAARCPECRGSIARRSKYGPDTCPECGILCCPFCWAAVGYHDCQHLLGSTSDGDWLGGPFEHEDLPSLEERLMDSLAGDASRKLGRLAPLFGAYDDTSDRPVRPARALFFEAALKVARIRVARRSWEGGGCGLSSCSTTYFSREAEKAIGAIRLVVADWQQAVHTLAASQRT